MMAKALMRSNARVGILSLLILGSEGRYHVREIERRIGENLNGVRRELANLERLGLVRSSRSSNLKYYYIERSSPVYPELRSFFLKTEGVAETVLRLSKKPKRVRMAFIFGSFAAGDETPSSDIDLFIVGEVDERSLLRSIGETEKFLGREVNYVLMSSAEFEEKLRAKDVFVSTVMASPRIPLSGTELGGAERAHQKGNGEER